MSLREQSEIARVAIQVALATNQRGHGELRWDGVPAEISRVSAGNQLASPVPNDRRAGAHARPEVSCGRVAHGAFVELLPKSLLRPQLVVEVPRVGGGPHQRGSGQRRYGCGRPIRNGGRRQAEPLIDGEPGQLPALVQVVPLALRPDLLQVGVVGVAAQSRNNLFHRRLVPLERLRLLADRVQIVDPIELELRLDAVLFWSWFFLHFFTDAYIWPQRTNCEK